MNTERASEVARRAALHAALSDPARLRIVDALSLGDAAPSELAAVLGMPSNLLAHHLRVLDAEGLITRTRSEGDKRRSYLRLVRAVLDGLAAPPLPSPARVLFVCTANSARSHLAAALWRRASPVPAVSAGTAPAARIDPGAIAAAERHGLPLRRLRPRSFGDVHDEADLVVTVCDRAHEQLGPRADLHWSIADPAALATAAAFDRAYAELAVRVADLAPRLQPAA
jgi:protein-tyrosine-phosphatase/DNA-binding HxlR family transcriptional regulator